ncbi:unnamed protein product [Malus baccata var. baccata]
MARTKLVSSSLCFAVLISCLGLIFLVNFDLFFAFLVTISILSTILLLANTNKKLVILDEKPVGTGNLPGGQENLPDAEQVRGQLLVRKDVKISKSDQQLTTSSSNVDMELLYSLAQEAESEKDVVKGLHQLAETLTETAQQSDQVEILDFPSEISDNLDEKFEVSDDCAVSDDEEEDSLIEIPLQSNLQQGVKEVLGDMSEMNEEENLIEIDISMGSIKFPRHSRWGSQPRPRDLLRKIRAIVVLIHRKGRRFSRFEEQAMVLLIIQQLLQENRHGSKTWFVLDVVCSRSLHVSSNIFCLNYNADQSVVDRAINDICILLHCSCHNLNVVSVGKGLVMGWLRFLEAGNVFDCINRPSLSLFMLKRLKGRGYPDIPTRRFLGLLVDTLHLPIYCLVDCDPYGFGILSMYRFGSMQMAYDAKFLRVPEVLWLGAFPSDSDKYGPPQQDMVLYIGIFLFVTLLRFLIIMPDKRKTEAMLLRCYLQNEAPPQWRLELQLMLERGVKFELEALSVHELNYLSENCVLKVSINCEACRKRIYKVLQNIYGVYKINIDAEGGTVKVSGKVNPSTLLMVLEGSGKHAEVKSVTFDGEVKNDWGGGYDYFGEAGYGYGYGYNPYGVAPPPFYPYPPYGGYDYHWYDPGRLKMMPLPALPPPPLALPSSSPPVPQQSQPPLPLQLQSQSVPPQPPKTPAPPNQAPPPPPPAANAAETIAKPAAKSDKKSKCCIMKDLFNPEEFLTYFYLGFTQSHMYENVYHNIPP